jgi:hypothetical protein
MDASTILITAIMIAIFILPVVLTGRSYKKKKNKLLKDLSRNIKQQGYSLSQHEICGNFIIGMDENSNTLFFYKKYVNNEISKVINLSEISGCQLLSNTKNVSSKNQHYSAIELIELVLSSAEKGRPDTILELYNTEFDSSNITEEFQIAEKWKKLVNDRIKQPDKLSASKNKKIV